MRGGRYQEPLVQAAVAKTKSSSGGWEGVMRGRSIVVVFASSSFHTQSRKKFVSIVSLVFHNLRQEGSMTTVCEYRLTRIPQPPPRRFYDNSL
ncbi:hypothetical protein RRG08_049385 [Elysia crispata]|uniref:Uncharacterized protein n=1 Tax=Elysia crispata TaxID=231223 RepID=A0AAE0XEM4_9GAST|nr:hypothetical protein RRG08_049385 [Elysia crispata]